jgi:hypothetical protein
MTDKQIEKVKSKIEKCKKALAADKKYWGGYYHDGSGIRYYLPQLYIEIDDFKGGLRYLNWFDKNFPDDSGFPVFLFESTFILFKCGRIKEAEIKAYRTFYSDITLFDRFLEKSVLRNVITEDICPEKSNLPDSFKYSRHDLKFKAFAEWIEGIFNNLTFLKEAEEFIQIERQLKNIGVGKKRSDLVERLHHILYQRN